MDKGNYFYLIILYVGIVFMSMMFALTEEDVKKFNLNKKWKRVLWLISSFAFIPFVIFLFRTPFFIFGQIKKFIAGKE
jgi:NADH:ubiquinone oxidoreductase subunit 6 (subunit J)